MDVDGLHLRPSLAAGMEHPIPSGMFSAPGGITWRSISMGSLLGTLLCASNTYFGLQVGWVTMGSLQSALLCWILFNVARKHYPLLPGLTVSEHVMVSTIATASATMPLAAGFVGIIPALRILQAKGYTSDPPLQRPGDQILWSLSVCFLGVFVAVPLRTYLKQLRFPSGTATASLIRSLHSHPHSGTASQASDGEENGSTTSSSSSSSSTPGVDASTDHHPSPSSPSSPPHLSLVSKAFATSAALSLAAFCLPVLGGLPVATWVGLPGVTSWSWVLTLSLSYVGQGMIMGRHTCVSMAAGAVVAWGVVGPGAAAAGWVKVPLDRGPTGGRGFNLWISLSILLAEAAVTSALAIKGMVGGGGGGGGGEVGGGVTSPDGGKKSALVGREGEEGEARFLSTPTTTTTTKSNNTSPSSGYDMQPIDVGFLGGGDSTGTAATAAAAAGAGASAISTATPTTTSTSPTHHHFPDPVLPQWVWVTGLIVSGCVAVVVLVSLAKVSVGEALLSVVMSLPISVIAVRCLGETDLNPVSGLGKLSQVVFGALFPLNSLVGNVLAGAVAEAGAQQAGDLMQDLKTGYLLGVPLPAQFTGQCLGSVVSVFASVAAFAAFDRAYGVPSLSLPAPTAAVWVAMAELMHGGGLPSAVVGFMWAGGVVSMGITLVVAWAEGVGVVEAGQTPEAATAAAVARPQWQVALLRAVPYLPSPTAFSIGMYVTANWSIPRLVGALAAGYLVEKRGATQQTVILIATGLVLGEGVMSLATALITTMGARPLSCAGCAVGLCGNFC